MNRYSYLKFMPRPKGHSFYKGQKWQYKNDIPSYITLEYYSDGVWTIKDGHGTYTEDYLREYFEPI